MTGTVTSVAAQKVLPWLELVYKGKLYEMFVDWRVTARKPPRYEPVSYREITEWFNADLSFRCARAGVPPIVLNQATIQRIAHDFGLE